MKNNSYRLITILLISWAMLTSCNAAQETQVISDPSENIEAEQHRMSSRFTVDADEDLKQSITLLFQSFYPGEAPAFVDNEPDLIATRTFECEQIRPCIWSTFLPEAVFINRSEKAAVDDFISYAISPEGQQHLINAGELQSGILLDDQAGNTIEITQPITRVISTYGPSTSIIYSVHAPDRLVSASYLGARDPKGAAVMEKMDPRFPELMGDDFFSQNDFNVEQAAVLDPDLIITSARTTWLDTVEQLGIDIFLFDGETPERLREAIRKTGQLFGPNSAAIAEAWITYYDNVVASILEQTSGIPGDQRIRVLFTGTDPLRVASGEMYQTDIIQAAGGVSVSSELNGYWNDVNLEQIAFWNPDVIIVPSYGGATVEAITGSAEWQILEAVKKGQVFQMPKLVVPWDTPAPDSILGIVWMAQLINSDLEGIDCASETEYFYKTFYRYSITPEEILSVCHFE